MRTALNTLIDGLTIAAALVGFGGLVWFIGALLSTNHLEDD